MTAIGARLKAPAAINAGQPSPAVSSAESALHLAIVISISANAP